MSNGNRLRGLYLQYNAWRSKHIDPNPYVLDNTTRMFGFKTTTCHVVAIYVYTPKTLSIARQVIVRTSSIHIFQ
jgi:hypothetical protein